MAIDTVTVQAEALRWVTLLNSSATPQWQAGCQRWCERHPAHAAAFEEAQAWWIDVGEAAAMRGRAPEWPPMPLAPPQSYTYDYQPPMAACVGAPGLEEINAVVHAGSGRPAVAAVMVLALTAALWWSLDRFDEVTGFGESRTVRLADGSKLQLDTDTAVDINLRGSERRLDLAHGEVFVEPAGTGRPLRIDAGIGQVRLQDGTVSVRRDRDGTVAVAVERGEAEVTGGALTEPTVLRAGERIRFDARSSSGVQPGAAARALAWRKGELQFEDQALAQVMDEVRRYDRRFWYLPDGAAAQTRLSTVVSFEQIDGWLDALPQAAPVEIVRIGPLVWARDRSVRMSAKPTH
ncbi:FecR family protein [Variovorax sp. ZT4R33]|uniref:FecR family protein n=1 Tax=Variovorax sp. ZT4R33 TaxID=3443743 RepID=UPI003F48C2B8